MTKQTARRDVGTVRVVVELRGQFPSGQVLYHARIVGQNFGITPEDCIGGDSVQCIAEVKALLVERGLTGRLRVASA